ncbi:MAG: hypothetical protein AAF483_11220 [Planctomycetota bacterium]
MNEAEWTSPIQSKRPTTLADVDDLEERVEFDQGPNTFQLTG